MIHFHREHWGWGQKSSCAAIEATLRDCALFLALISSSPAPTHPFCYLLLKKRWVWAVAEGVRASRGECGGGRGGEKRTLAGGRIDLGHLVSQESPTTTKRKAKWVAACSHCQSNSVLLHPQNKRIMLMWKKKRNSPSVSLFLLFNQTTFWKKTTQKCYFLILSYFHVNNASGSILLFHTESRSLSGHRSAFAPDDISISILHITARCDLGSLSCQQCASDSAAPRRP